MKATWVALVALGMAGLALCVTLVRDSGPPAGPAEQAAAGTQAPAGPAPHPAEPPPGTVPLPLPSPRRLPLSESAPGTGAKTDPEVHPAAASLVSLLPPVVVAQPAADPDPPPRITHLGEIDQPLLPPDRRVYVMSTPLRVGVTAMFQEKDTLTVTAKGVSKSFTATVEVKDVKDKGEQEIIVPLADFNRPGAYILTATIKRGPDGKTIPSTPRDLVIEARALENVPRIQKVVEDGSHEWSPASPLTPALSGSLKVTVGGGLPGQTVTLVRSDDPDATLAGVSTAPGPEKADGPVEITTSALAPGGYQLQARASQGTISKALSSELIRMPSTDLSAPVVTEVSNGTYAEFTANEQTTNQVTTVYDGYLRLRGQRAPVGGRLRLVVRDEGANSKALRELPAEATIGPGGEWQADLNLPIKLDTGVTHKLLVRAEAGGKHRYSGALGFQVFEAAKLPAPTEIKLDNLTPQGQGRDANVPLYLSNATELAVSVKVSSQPADTQAVLVAEEGPKPGTVLGKAALTGTTTKVTLRDLTEGTYRITAFLARGKQKSESQSSPIDLAIKRGGLRVQSVQPTNFGTAPGVRALTIQFTPENPLDKTAAVTPEHYVLRASNASGSFDRGLDRPVDKPFATEGQPIVFDDRTNTVTLRFRELGADIYQLEVKSATLDVSGKLAGGLFDVYGNRLEDENRVQGRSYKIVLGKPAADGGFEGGELPSQTRGITGRPGPYVAFPEYTPPRLPVSGVNPSDRVETRVVRLYYYRDAHRVAQIVNRNVKSYNYQAVEVRRRLADKARDVADSLTDERRALERRSVEAAHRAREAERVLTQAQTALAQARRGADQASAAAQALDGQVAAAQNQLAQATDTQKAWQEEVAQRKANAPPGVPEAQGQLALATDAVRNASARLQGLEKERARAQASLTAESNNLTTAEDRVRAALADVQATHNTEVAENEKALALTAREDRSREEQFRREVAAAHEDPDTYAPGKVDSQDPVQQCSISVIGEGEIQLRGPIKGLNIIRTMINLIDAPVGQVRVAIHTAQVNGEHGDRMEKVVNRIQKHIDHSRFLTAQSAQMLRKAVVLVASRKADQALATCPPGSQAARDQRYLYAFFGQDFIQELESLDSEFLKTGNKLLSLHSMDSTSLSAALFLLALAKNTTRVEILEEFQRMTRDDLPQAEQWFLEAGGADKDCKKFTLLGYNARFQSLRGFFDAEVVGEETMTPIQREFVRLAQIFKSRLITELELQQRVTERTIIEERLGDYLAELQKARDKEQKAQDALEVVQRVVQAQQLGVLTATETIDRVVEGVLADLQRAADLQAQYAQSVESVEGAFKFVARSVAQAASELATLAKDPEAIRKVIEGKRAGALDSASGAPLASRIRDFVVEVYRTLGPPLEERNFPKESLEQRLARSFRLPFRFGGREVTIVLDPRGQVSFPDACDQAFVLAHLQEAYRKATGIQKTLAQFQVEEPDRQKLCRADGLLELVARLDPAEALANLERCQEVFGIYREVVGHVAPTAQAIARGYHDLVAKLARRDADVPAVYAQWLILRQHVLTATRGEVRTLTEQRVREVDDGFARLLEANLRRQLALTNLEEARRPLDHKKLLDMLIDEVEDKYIELLEGTRAHTANIDNYIKSVSTALDDDFQTQFYLPAFRGVREASRYWDVQLGKIETTSILTNNRAFAKVSPEATMEFDLPKRDILISEAMNGSLAMMQTYGALLQDPTFLALTKLRSGQPTSSPVQGAAGGLSPVRNVLPGLPSSTDERVLSQAGPGERRLASPLEALIPDPAIYKFETGTGYEIRPVISPDGQSVVFHFQYMYTTNIREPVRADEKHLGRVKRHFIDTDVQLGNYELREISRYVVALKASRTSRGVPLLQDIPGVGVLFRPLPSAESSLQENVILGQAVVFPTLFDLMGLRWAPAVSDLDTLRSRNAEFAVRMRRRDLENHVYDFATSKVDEFLRIPPAERRTDLYRTQETIPYTHPSGYRGPGLNLRDGQLREGYDPRPYFPETRFVPGESREGVPGQPGNPGLIPGGPFPSPPGAGFPPAGPLDQPPPGLDPHLPGPHGAGWPAWPVPGQPPVGGVPGPSAGAPLLPAPRPLTPGSPGSDSRQSPGVPGGARQPGGVGPALRPGGGANPATNAPPGPSATDPTGMAPPSQPGPPVPVLPPGGGPGPADPGNGPVLPPLGPAAGK
jgi:hypothetical protein